MAAAMLLLGAGQLKGGAATLTYTSFQPETEAGWYHDFILPKFDPSLGTLDSVRITVDYDITASASLSNTSASSKCFSFEAGSWLSLDLPRCLGELNVWLFANNVHYSLPGHGTASYWPLSADGSAEITLTGCGLSPFIGTGTLEFPTQTRMREVLAGGDGKITSLVTTFASALLKIEYFDMPVPEPPFAGLLLLALGLLPLTERARP